MTHQAAARAQAFAAPGRPKVLPGKGDTILSNFGYSGYDSGFSAPSVDSVLTAAAVAAAAAAAAVAVVVVVVVVVVAAVDAAVLVLPVPVPEVVAVVIDGPAAVAVTK